MNSSNPDDPLFCMLINAAQRAGIRSIPVESTWERTVLDNLDFQLNCDGPGCNNEAEWFGEAHCCGATALGCTPCKTAIETRLADTDTPVVHNQCKTEVTIDDFTYTPLPEGNR